jgi:hypothetical protein
MSLWELSKRTDELALQDREDTKKVEIIRARWAPFHAKTGTVFKKIGDWVRPKPPVMPAKKEPMVFSDYDLLFINPNGMPKRDAKPPLLYTFLQ